MRYAAYASASTALAAAVVFHAFNQRPNFYSATVYLAQSQACRMILLNLVLLSAYSFVRTLQKLLYGPLRAIEREQLWDKSWYAITETALAMTTFRDEVGAYFLVMFVCLLGGKVWSWMSEGRVDILEQQPPSNPGLFHARLITSLLISELFAVLMLQYCVNTLLDQPRPGMMVMFAFEFAVLLITSTSILMRYLLAVQETLIVRRQTKERLEERRQEVREAREEAERQIAENPSETAEMSINLPREEDIDENDIDVPGWQEKGRWILFLDLFTDFFKLIVYMLFFSLLLLFHGIPIHIIRDVYVTTRSFLKRISDFQKYRNATRDMNEKYPDATAQELERDGTCIICREEMRPWEQPEQRGADAGARGVRRTLDERQRPKKLPCGHILHLGCLRSWLERQQVCPTCRTSVLAPGTSQTASNNNLPNQARPGAAPGPPGAQGPAGERPPNAREQAPAQQPIRARTFNLGPWRFTFAAGDAGQVRDTLRRINHGQAPANPQANAGNTENAGNASGTNSTSDLLQNLVPGGGVNSQNIQSQLAEMEQQIVREIGRLQLTSAQLETVRGLQVELTRLRMQNTLQLPMEQRRSLPMPQTIQPMRGYVTQQPMVRSSSAPYAPLSFAQTPRQHLALGSNPQQAALGPGHPDLPSGMTLPEGWNLVPLQRRSYAAQPATHRSQSPLDETSSADIALPDVVPQTSQRSAGMSNGGVATELRTEAHGANSSDSLEGINPAGNDGAPPTGTEVRASRLANLAGSEQASEPGNGNAIVAAGDERTDTSVESSNGSSSLRRDGTIPRLLSAQKKQVASGHTSGSSVEESSVPDWSWDREDRPAASPFAAQGSSSNDTTIPSVPISTRLIRDDSAGEPETVANGHSSGSHKTLAATVEDADGEDST